MDFRLHIPVADEAASIDRAPIQPACDRSALDRPKYTKQTI